jgi:competence protein ComEC
VAAGQKWSVERSIEQRGVRRPLASNISPVLRRFFRRLWPFLALIVIATVTMLTGYLLGRDRPQPPAPNRIQVTVLNVQHGEAAWIRTGNGKFILLGAGPSAQGEIVAASLKKADCKRIALLVLPNGEPSAIGGASVVAEALPIDEVLTPGLPIENPVQERVEKRLAAQNVRVKAGRAGEVMMVDGVRIEILAPADPLLADPPVAGNNSLVLRLVWKETYFLFAGGIAAKGENVLLSRLPDLSAQWLRVARYGSREATSSEFLRLVSPEHIIVSVGTNRDNLPHPETLDRIEATGAKLYRTDTAAGPLVFFSDGVQIWGSP